MATDPKALEQELDLAYQKFSKAHEAGDRENAKRFRDYALELEKAIEESRRQPAAPQESGIEVDEAAPKAAPKPYTPPKAEAQQPADTGIDWGEDIPPPARRDGTPILIPPGSTKPTQKTEIEGGDLWTAIKYSATSRVSNYLSARENIRRRRNLTTSLVARELPEEWRTEIESSADKPIKSMTFMELDIRARRRYGDKYDEVLGRLKENPSVASMIDEAKTDSGVNLYESIIRPAFSPSDEFSVADVWKEKLDSTVKQYSESAQQGREKPFLNPEATIEPGTWFEGTKMPWEDLDAFVLSAAENSVQIGEGIAAAAVGGKAAGPIVSRLVGRTATPQALRAATDKVAGRLGMAAGATSEAYSVKDQVEAETFQRLQSLPDEKWQTDEEYHRLRDGGLTDEEARFVRSQELSATAGNVAGVVSGLALGAPMGYLYGKLAGRQSAALGSREMVSALSRSTLGAAKGFAGEAAQEGTQEFTENTIGNVAVRMVDQEQQIFAGGLNAFLGGAAMGGAYGLAGGALSAATGVPGIDKETQKILDASRAWESAAKARWKLQAEIGDPNWGTDMLPGERLRKMVDLENLQMEEAEAFNGVEPLLRKQMTANNAGEAEFAALDRMAASAKATIDRVKQSRESREESQRAAEEQRKVDAEREQIRVKIELDQMKLADVERMADNIHKVRSMQALEQADYEELQREGYGRWNVKGDKFIITPKGVRAAGELERQAELLNQRLQSGYTGPERRANLQLRERIKAMSPEQLEAAVYLTDKTNLLNRRAFDEAEKDNPSPAYAEIDADSVAWVNDNWGHEYGDKLLSAIADAVREETKDLDGVAAYHKSGDEFAITGTSEEQLEEIMQRVKTRLQGSPIVNGKESVLPTVTWGTGPTSVDADKTMLERKKERTAAGKRADRKARPATWQSSSLLLMTGGEDVDAEPAGEHGKAQLSMLDVGYGYGFSGGEGMRFGPARADALAIPAEFAELVGDPSNLSFVRDGNGHEAISGADAKRIIEAIAEKHGIETPSSVATALSRSQVPLLEAGIRVLGREIDLSAGTVRSIIDGDAKTVALDTMNKILAGFRVAVSKSSPGMYNADSEQAALPAAWASKITLVKPSLPKQKAIRETPRFAAGSQQPFDFDFKPRYTTRAKRASRKHMRRAEAAMAAVFGQYKNLPTVTLVNTVDDLPSGVLADLRAMGGNPYGVRGMFDEKNPANGVFIVVANNLNVLSRDLKKPVSSIKPSELEGAIIETAFHEIVGHYGLRGLVGSQENLDRLAELIVKSFPREATATALRIGANMALPRHRALVGEETFAYLAGEILAKRITLDPKERTLFRRAINWVKTLLRKLKFDRFLKMTDRDMMALIAEAQIFVKSGNKWKFQTMNGETLTPYMRNMEMFKNGMLKAVQEGTKPLNKNERAALAAKDPAMAGVKEMPLFPETGTVSAYIAAVEYAMAKLGYVSKTELTASGIMEMLRPPLLRKLAFDVHPETLDENGRGLTDQQFAAHFGVPLEDLDEFLLSNSLTEEQVAKAQELVERFDLDRDIYSSERLAANNGLNAQQLRSYVDGGIDEQIKLLPPRVRPKVEELLNIRSQAMSSRDDQYINATLEIDKLFRAPADPKTTVINKKMILKWLTDAFAHVEIFPWSIADVDPTDAQAVKLAYTRITGQRPLLPGYAHDQLNDNAPWTAGDAQSFLMGLDEELRERVIAEMAAIKAKGYDYGFDPQLNRWFDWVQPNKQHEHSRYTPAGLSTEEYMTVALYDKSAMKVRSESIRHGHYSGSAWPRGNVGVLFHIRQSVVNDASKNPPTAPNSKYQGKAWYLVELQTDWFDKHRSLNSEAARVALTARTREKGDALFTSIGAFTDVVSRQVFDAMVEKTKSIIESVLPDAEQDADAWLSAATESVKQNESKRIGVQPENLRQVLIERRLKSRTSERLSMLAGEIVNFMGDRNTLLHKATSSRRLRITADAREIARANNMAVKEFLWGMSRRIVTIREAASNANWYTSWNGTEPVFSDEFKDILTFGEVTRASLYDSRSSYSSLSVHQHIANAIGTSQLSRLGYAKKELRRELELLYDKLGIDLSKLDHAMSSLSEAKVYRWSVPLDTIPVILDGEKAMHAGADSFIRSAIDYVHKVDHRYSSENFRVQSDVGNADSDVSISYTGLVAESLDEAKEVLLKAIDHYVSNELPQLFDAWADEVVVNTTRQRERNRLSSSDDQELAKKTIQWLGLEEKDTDEFSNVTEYSLGHYGIVTKEDYVSERLPDEIDFYRENGENYIDWSAEEFDDHPLDTDHPEYRSRVVVDADENEDATLADAWLEERRRERVEEMLEGGGYLYQMAEEAAASNYEDQVIYHAILPSGIVNRDLDPIPQVEIVQVKSHSGDWSVWVDGEYVAEGLSRERDADIKLMQGVIAYLEDNRVIAWKPEFPWSQQAPAQPDPVDRPEKPDFTSYAKAIAGEIEKSGEATVVDAGVLYEQVIDAAKITSSPVVPKSHLAKDEVWRLIALRYIIADAVRRGIPKVMWHGGEGTSKRGGGLSFTTVERIVWRKASMEVNGKTKDVVVIETPRYSGNSIILELSADRIAPVLGQDVYELMMRQIAGKAPLRAGEADISGTPQLDDLVIGRAGESWVLHRVGDPSILSIATTREEIEGIRSQMFADAQRNGSWTAVLSQSPVQRSISSGYGESHEETARLIADFEAKVPNLGVSEADISMSGEITGDMLGGGYIYLATHETDSFMHTPAGADSYGARLMGARINYDGMLNRIWSKELKKYGVQITSGAAVVPSSMTADEVRAEGLRVTSSYSDAFVQQYGTPVIVKISGETSGFAVVSNAGPILNRVYWTKDEAERALNEFVRTKNAELLSTKLYEFTINDALREAFSGPVVPFNYDPYKDPVLKAAAERIGSRKPSLRSRIDAWRRTWKDSFLQGTFDRFHGIKSAMTDADLLKVEAAQNPYIQARLSTSLDSVMTAVMDYGHPIWKDGIVQTEGRGLAEVLRPVSGQIELWAMYMAGVRAKRLLSEGRENLFKPEEIDAMVKLGDVYPMFKEVAKDYAAFHKRVLDFAQEAGVINPETRPMWENADYVPFYRVEDDRLVGPLGPGRGIANVRSPIKQLKGGTENVQDIMHNIMVNLTNLVDGAMKNHAALLAVDSLRQSGIIAREPLAFSAELIPLEQVKKLLIDKGINPATIPPDALSGFQKMFALQAPKGDGIISVLRNGKKEFYYTDDPILFRALSSINQKSWGAWMSLLRGPKRLLTSWVTLDPGFMIANFMRDALSAFVISRDKFIPMAAGLKGFAKALVKDEDMRTLLSSGASFESGFISQGDPETTKRMLKAKMKDKSFARTVLDSPVKLYEAWKAIGSAAENANRLAVYQAALRAGKSKAQAAYEAKDLMDFSMSGDWPMIQFLIQTVPFMNARLQGLYRLGRGAAEHPVAFTMKGALVGMAGLALWFAFKDDERYKDLEDWDKDTYFHFWIDDQHYRLPKPFEIGAIFNTIPERIFEYMYSNETDAGKLLLKRFGFMLTETFSMNPIPQAVMPMVESWFNKSFFTGNQIVSPFEEQRLPPEQYRYYTAPTFIELGRALPAPLDLASDKIRSPLQLQNLYYGYTGTLGRYFVMGSDALLRHYAEMPMPPEKTIAEYPVIGRFARGDDPRRTRYEEEFYNMLRKTLQVQNSVRFLDKVGEDERIDYIEGKYDPYIVVAKELENARQQVQKLDQQMREIYLDPAMTPQEKRREVDQLQTEKNAIFKEAYLLRPGGPENRQRPATQEEVKFLIERFNFSQPESNKLREVAPITADLLQEIKILEPKSLASIAKLAPIEESPNE